MTDAATLPSLLDRLARRRDRLLGSQRFRRWASGFPLTRPIARRRASALFDLCAGFVYSQVLLACVRLRLFDFVAEAPRSVADVARHAGIDVAAAGTLVDAAVSLGLLSRRGGGRFGPGELGAALIDNPGLSAMIEHHALLYRDLEDPVAALAHPGVGTELGRYWAYARNVDRASVGEGEVQAYTDLMSASQALIADQVLDAYPLERRRCLMDVGGGDGSFLAAAAERHPGLELVLFDLPAVAERGRARLAAAGLGPRTRIIGGDFFNEALPSGADVVSLVRVIHDHDDADAMRLLRAVRACLPPKGVLLLAEPMSGVRGAESMADAYFGFYLMVMGSGRPRSAATLMLMLGAAGFHETRRVPTAIPLQTSLIVASP